MRHRIIELEFDEDALELIAKEAIRRKTGARGLRGVIEEIMLDMMYEAPSRNDIAKIIIDEDVIKSKEKPKLELKTVDDNIDGSKETESVS